MRCLLLSISVLALLVWQNAALAAEAHKECSLFNAVYAPAKNTPADKTHSFFMTVDKAKPDENGGSNTMRAVFFSFHVMQDKKEIAMLRLGDACSNGVVTCSISDYYGQFGTLKQMKEFKPLLNFNLVALDRDFNPVSYRGPDAPYAFILPRMAAQIYYAKNNPTYSENLARFVRFYTNEKKLPNALGHDVWLRKSCDRSFIR